MVPVTLRSNMLRQSYHSKMWFLDHIEYGDVVLADRGVNIQDDLAIIRARLEISAFTNREKTAFKGWSVMENQEKHKILHKNLV